MKFMPGTGLLPRQCSQQNGGQNSELPFCHPDFHQAALGHLREVESAALQVVFIYKLKRGFPPSMFTVDPAEIKTSLFFKKFPWAVK